MRQPQINIATRAARAGAREILRLMNRRDNLNVAEKAKHDYVSEADRAAERAIVYELQKAYPDHAILTEEQGMMGSSDHCWIVDPLDGTTNFLQGIPHFSISIALKIGDTLEHGLVYDPLREELFTASKGGGAYLNDRRLRCGSRKHLEGALVGTGFPFRRKAQLGAYLKSFEAVFEKASDVRRMGSAALDLAYVAADRLEAFWEIDLAAWDMAAGALLIQEAGGVCTDFGGRSNYLESGNIIAGNLKTAQELRETVTPHFDYRA